MIVLGHRVLITPDEQPQASGGIELPQDREWVATSGTVVQVGPGGSKLKYDARQRALKAAIEAIQRPHQSTNEWFHGGIRQAVERVRTLLGTFDPPQDVQVGDRVAFDGDHGVKLTVDGEDFVILNQDDVVIIVQEAEEAA
jgi:co-chaperonin GroES (HSP10)